MPRAFALVSASLVVCLLVLASGTARAAPATQSTPVSVLTVRTDDADDAADALTQALRAQVRASPGWLLVDSAQSFETLAIALRCPAKPDAACLQRIGDQLHATRYVWGTASKRKGGDVEAEVHMWTRGRTSVDSAGTFPDTVKDATDPALHATAERMWEELSGSPPLATLVVHAGAAEGTVIVDGEDRGPLRSGMARITVTAGEHTVAVHVPGFRAAQQTPSVAPRSEREVEFALSPESANVEEGVHEQAATERHGGVGTKSIVGYSAIAVGVGLLVAAAVEAGAWVGDKNASARDRADVPNTVSQVCDYQSDRAQDACQQGKNAKTASVLGWVFAGAGAALVGTGTWLVVSDAQAAESSHNALRIRVVPEIGAQRQVLSLQVAF